MVTLAQPAGTYAFWPQNNHLLSYGSLVPCQWHGLPAVSSNCCGAPVDRSPYASSSPYVSPLPVQPHPCLTSISSSTAPHHHHQQHRGLPHHYQSLVSSLSPTLTQTTPRTVDPDKPIGYGSFGVVWSVVNTQDGSRAALKKIPNVFQSLLACIRTFREVKILCELKHENLLSSTDFIHPPPLEQFNDVLVLCDLMESDLHQIIVSPQKLSEDHVKVFIYQILRGLKYLHSADIIHRDLKPGNLLVNSNCLLKICDFGFARAVEPDPNTAMTLEVVTQFYRAPELLAGCKHYDTSIDMWSVGCILAELLGRRILFEASSPEAQLEMITDLLGTPSLEDVRHVTSSAMAKSLVSQSKPSAMSKLYQLSSDMSHSAVHLLSQMLIFNPVKRLSCSDALVHPFLEDGKMRYHTYLCSCCHTLANGSKEFTGDFEPSAAYKFDPSYEKDLTSIARAKIQLYEYIRCVRPHLSPLYINIYSKHFKKFQGCSPGVPQITTVN